LQQRFYYDANAGTLGGLVFKGEFVDEIAGEDYLNLNVLGTADLAELQALCPKVTPNTRPSGMLPSTR
jgi:hypothetical protein